MSEFDSLSISIEKHVAWRFRNRCKFYDLNQSVVVTALIEKFNNGDFDVEFDIPTD